MAQNLLDYPWLNDPAGHLATSERAMRETFVAAVMELYNPAQRDVMSRAGVLAHELAQRARASGREAGETAGDGTA